MKEKDFEGKDEGGKDELGKEGIPGKEETTRISAKTLRERGKVELGKERRNFFQ